MANQHTHKEYDSNEINKIINLYESGISLSKNSELLNRKKNNIKKILIDNNVWVEGRDNVKKNLNEELIIDLYNSGLSLQKIADKLNISKSPIKRVIKGAGILRSGTSSGKKIELSLKDKDMIKRLYLEEFKNSDEIAEELKLSKSFVDKYLHNSDYRRNRSKATTIGLVKRYNDMDYNEWLENLPEYQKYKSDVMKVTNRQPIHTLPNYNNRGVSGIDGAYHLDHKFSINEGFRQNVDQKLIGNIVNLEFIPWEENLNKGTKCSITITELKKL